MRALSVRQPYAELILRGIKTAELRSMPTRIVGERFYIYASLAKAKRPIWSNDLEAATLPPPLWMIELAEQVKLIEPGAIELLPRGVIVGTAVIERCESVAGCELLVASGQGNGDGAQLATSNQTSASSVEPQQATMFKWQLADVRRIKRLRKPARHPQPVWFKPF